MAMERVTASVPVSNASGPPQRLNVALWTVQVLLAAFYGAVGATKATQPISKLAAMIGWPGVLPPAFVRFVGTAEFAGPSGLLLPMLTRVAPRLTVFAAFGLIALQLCAMVFDTSRGEFYVPPIISVLLALAAFVAWGRRPSAGCA